VRVLFSPHSVILDENIILREIQVSNAILPRECVKVQDDLVSGKDDGMLLKS